MCPTAPPIEVEGGSLAVRILLLTLESIGAEGFIGFFGGLFLFLGCMKLSLGGVICCRKTKAQEYADRMKEKDYTSTSCSVYVRCVDYTSITNRAYYIASVCLVYLVMCSVC